jgi:putative endonuclease
VQHAERMRGALRFVIPAARRSRADPAGTRPGRNVCYAAGMKQPCVYILVNRPHRTFYVGVTSDLYATMADHDQGLIEGFTKQYGIKMLVYYEHHETMDAAIRREKLLKRWRREWKYRLVEQMNPEWRNLFDPATGEIAFGPAEVERLSSEPEQD